MRFPFRLPRYTSGVFFPWRCSPSCSRFRCNKRLAPLFFAPRTAGGDHVRSFKMDPQVFAGSKPEKRAMDARDGSLAHFVYTKDGDNGGLIYWLGTRR